MSAIDVRRDGGRGGNEDRGELVSIPERKGCPIHQGRANTIQKYVERCKLFFSLSSCLPRRFNNINRGGGLLRRRVNRTCLQDMGSPLSAQNIDGFVELSNFTSKLNGLSQVSFHGVLK